MLCLAASQTSRSTVPKIRECDFVSHEEDDAPEQIENDHLSDCNRNHVPKGKPKKDNQTSRAAEYGTDLEKHAIINGSLFRRSKKDNGPPSSIDIREPIHKIFDSSHKLKVA
jgi:hypothetical protein